MSGFADNGLHTWVCGSMEMSARSQARECVLAGPGVRTRLRAYAQKKATHTCIAYITVSSGVLSQLGYIFHSARLEVSGFPPMDDVILCKFIQHLLHLWIHFKSYFLVFFCTELTQCVTHCLCVIAVVQSTLFILAYALNCRFVVCHYLVFIYLPDCEPQLVLSILRFVVPSRIELLFRE